MKTYLVIWAYSAFAWVISGQITDRVGPGESATMLEAVFFLLPSLAFPLLTGSFGFFLGGWLIAKGMRPRNPC